MKRLCKYFDFMGTDKVDPNLVPLSHEKHLNIGDTFEQETIGELYGYVLASSSILATKMIQLLMNFARKPMIVYYWADHANDLYERMLGHHNLPELLYANSE